MKCPHCVDGKINLFSSVVQCEDCGGTGVLIKNRAYIDPPLVTAKIDIEPQYSNGKLKNNRKFKWRMGIDGNPTRVCNNELSLITFLEKREVQSWVYGGNMFASGVNYTQGEFVGISKSRKFEIISDKSPLETRGIIDFCVFRASYWYKVIKSNATRFLYELLVPHQGQWKQEPIANIQSKGKLVTVSVTSEILDFSIENKLKQLAESFVNAAGNPRGRCSSLGSFEGDSVYAIKISQDGYGLRFWQDLDFKNQKIAFKAEALVI